MEIMIFETIKEAYETSTRNANRFAAALDSIKWDDHFIADGEHYFRKGGLTLVTESLDPFVCAGWNKPSALFADGSYIEL